MRKGTIFRYELRRLLFSKEYLLLLIVTLTYCSFLLRSVVLYGANYTAPFSPLTFLTYCASLAPVLFILLLVLCARQSKASELGAETLIRAAPMPLPVFRLLRYGAIGCAFLIAAALPVMACFVFYRLVFDYTAIAILFWMSLLFLLPPAPVLIGTVMLFGNKRAVATYVLLSTVLIVSVFQIPLPAVLDIFGSSAVLTPAFIAGRVALLGIGIAFITASLFQSKKQLI